MQVIKALDKLKRVANWVGMTIPTEQYCKVCQQSKLPMPPSAHMTNAPIGRPWQMLAVDVLEVHHVQQRKLISTGASRPFHKWTEPIPMPEETADRIAQVLIDIFSRFGIPAILHSDQGRTIL